MLDSANLESAGVRTLTFVTPPFVAAAHAVARSRGLPGLAMVIVEEHDVDTLQIPASVVDRVIALLDP